MIFQEYQYVKRQALFVTFLFSLFSTPVQAETVYVTDLLRLNLYEQPNPQGEVIKTVISGEVLEVIERQPRFAKIRTRGGVIGWTKSAYLVSEKPPRLIVTNIKKQLVKMKKKVKSTINDMQTAVVNAEKYQQQLITHTNNTKAQDALLQKLQLQNQEFEKSMKTYESSVPMNAYLISVVVFFLLGIGLSWYIIDYKIRKRHGGFRIY